MDLGRLGRWEKLALAGAVVALVGTFLPWIVFHRVPLSAVQILIGSEVMSRQSSPALSTAWAAIVGTILLGFLAAAWLTVAPARGGDRRPRLALAAGAVGLVVTLLLAVLGLRLGVGYGLTVLGGLGLVGGRVMVLR